MNGHILGKRAGWSTIRDHPTADATTAADCAVTATNTRAAAITGRCRCAIVAIETTL
jgi:hypothetical protein